MPALLVLIPVMAMITSVLRSMCERYVIFYDIHISKMRDCSRVREIL